MNPRYYFAGGILSLPYESDTVLRSCMSPAENCCPFVLYICVLTLQSMEGAWLVQPTELYTSPMLDIDIPLIFKNCY